MRGGQASESLVGASAHSTALDGVRGLAIIMVVSVHAHLPGAQGGWLGVDIFFVLSGYLITGQILNPNWHWEVFAWRRAARLWPALIVLCMATFAAALITGTSTRVLAALTYTYTPVLFLDGQQADPLLGHCWSLAVEVQFYVAWAIALGLLRSRPRAVVVKLCLTLAGTSFALQAVLAVSAHQTMAYFATPARLGGLFLGSAVASGFSATRTRRPLLVASSVVLVAALPWATLTSPRDLVVFGIVAAIFAATAVAEVVINLGGFADRALSAGWLAWLGQRSYSLYLWHLPVFALTRSNLPSPIAGLVMLITAAALAYGSFRWIEVPARRWLNAHGPRRSPSGVVYQLR